MLVYSFYVCFFYVYIVILLQYDQIEILFMYILLSDTNIIHIYILFSDENIVNIYPIYIYMYPVSRRLAMQEYNLEEHLTSLQDKKALLTSHLPDLVIGQVCNLFARPCDWPGK